MNVDVDVEQLPPWCRTCGARLELRDPPGGHTPEQQWCGIWYDHPPLPGLPAGQLVGHTGTALVMSAELQVHLEELELRAAQRPVDAGRAG
ncbi:hypothetical protein [Saccharothrix sp. HUAS TT1]|uniref:hypothetical protein n=1 Tax=unclassified Saccharothrix TaxID=2593673 RepID=UPI00345B534E